MDGDTNQFSVDPFGNLMGPSGTPFITNTGDQIGANGVPIASGLGAALGDLIPGVPLWAWLGIGAAVVLALKGLR